MGISGNIAHIEVEALRVGMFVYLDGGWLSHPFALSSFKIASAEQLAIIRKLGVKRVRWSPERSEPDGPAVRLSLTAHERPAAKAPVESAEDAASRERRDALSAQRADVSRCGQQLSEATREHEKVTHLVMSAPAAAAERALALSRALVDKMLDEQEMCIRLINEVAGDKASAHAMNVAVISLLIGRSFGLSEPDMLDLGLGAMLHDIGKLDLPERVRHFDERFSTSEAAFYEEHVAHGVAYARRMGLSEGATLVVAQHHECFDKSGFPLKLGSEKISLASGIVALVNRYDNLCNPRIPSKALTPHESLSLLFAQGENKFDTAVLGAFIKMMGVYPPGSVVQLTDNRFALVVGVNASRPLKPRVLVYNPQVPADEALFVDLERVPNLGIWRSIKPLALPREALAYLSPRPRVTYFFDPLRERELETA